MTQPILQFGTGRFLQAHVDLFVSQASVRGEAIGGITVVQTSGNAPSRARIAAFAAGLGYRVEIRGRIGGRIVEETVQVDSIRLALDADTDWPQVMASVAGPVRVIVSNTADRGYVLSPHDSPRLLSSSNDVPRSFPAKLLVLLHHRWLRLPEADLSICPCELIYRNGDTLRGIVLDLARAWGATENFIGYLRERCVWVNSLVDRIVSEALEPIGAVTEPYALWAVEQQAGLVLPCRHPAIVVTEQLACRERLKLMLLNLGHSVLADRWLAAGSPDGQTVFDAMNQPSARGEVEAIWQEEVLPVFDANDEGDVARAYLAEVRERLLNPFLLHRLADIAQGHDEKKRRRFAPVVERATAMGLGLPQARLKAALARADEAGP
ncbi:MAG: mannitol dehydrogenase family protein [Pseudomonadota bacterium]|nr:mannitol dehydrogenase family protein [Pseudomonadota bacterium]